MKKLLILAYLFWGITNVFSQVRVSNNGNTIMGLSTSQNPLSTLSVGCVGRAGSKVAILADSIGLYVSRNDHNSNWGNAIQCLSPVGSSNFSVGIRAEAVNTGTPLSSKRSYGVYCVAGNATSGWNYALFGRLYGSNNGAAIYGTIGNTENGVNTGGQYAGYFNGSTKVVGNLIVTGGIQGVVLGSSAAGAGAISTVALSDDIQEGNDGFADKIRDLKSFAYYLPQNYQTNTTDISTDSINSMPKISKVELQSIERMHYGFSGEQLKTIFPDLVYEQEDGTYGINYMEMIPILVGTINELNDRLTVIEGNRRPVAGNSAKAKVLSNSTSTINLEVEQGVQKVDVNIYDINGVLLKKINVCGRGIVSVDLLKEGLSAGLYIYALVVDDNVISTKRVAVEK